MSLFKKAHNKKLRVGIIMEKQQFEIRPAPMLLHAYHAVNKAFQGHIAINTYTEDVKISSENKQYLEAATHATKDIQIAYTNGTLNNDIIAGIINIHLPDDLHRDQTLPAFGTNIPFPQNLATHSLDTLHNLVDAINAQEANICAITGKTNVQIQTTDPKLFAKVYDILQESYAPLEQGKRLSDKQIKYLIQNSFEDDYENLNARSQKRKERRQSDSLKKDRVINHRLYTLEDINGVGLTPLAHHLLARTKHDDFPFAELESMHCYAKAVRNAQSVPSIRLQVPVFLNANKARDLEILTLAQRVIRETAKTYNEDVNATIDRKLVAKIAKKSASESKTFNNTATANQTSLEQLQTLTHEDFFIAVMDWLPMDERKILQNLGGDLNNPAQLRHIKTIMSDFIEDGMIVKSGDIYQTPAPFSAKNTPMQVIATDHEGNVYARPQDWDEATHGITPTIMIPEHMREGHNLCVYDLIFMDLDYHLGRVDDVKINAIERLHDPAPDDSLVYLDDTDFNEPPPATRITASKAEISTQQTTRQHTLHSAHNIFISPQAQIPDDGIIAGVITQGREEMYFKPSLAGVGSFVIPESANFTAGDIVTLRISAESRSFQEVTGLHGNIHEQAGLSKLSAVEQGIPLAFPDDILEGTPPLTVPPVSKDRIDFRNIPCITIDPPTAKDFDDAIHVTPNKDGWEVMVFIADVSYYMKPGTKLYEEAYKRGNSTYLPDLTIPMLPEELSNQICSLVPHEDRACLVTTMQINHEGEITKKKFDRGLMRSIARLNYDQVQEALEGNPDEMTAPLYHSHIQPAYDVYSALLAARERRGALNFNTPEQRIDMTEGEDKITLEIHNESHGIIEELMIASNIAAIETLIERDSKLLARVHGLPNERILNQFADQLADLGIVMPAQELPIEQRVEYILKQAENSPHEDDIRRLMVRAQDKAKYSAQLSEHYALKLDAYTHETSPIRRMTDWYIHCLINEACNLKEASRLPAELKQSMPDAAEHFSLTERRSMVAEQRTKLRLAAYWVEKHLGEEFDAAVTHVTEKGMFIKVAGKEIRSLIPAHELQHSASNDPESESYYKPGKAIKVKASEADPITGTIHFDLV